MFQRRRWTASLLANHINFLSQGRKVAKSNENISMLYVIYQGFLLCVYAIGQYCFAASQDKFYRTTI